MHLRLGFLAVALGGATAMVACGARTDAGLDDYGPVATKDASVDVARPKPKPDAAVDADVPYVPQGKRCVRDTDAGAPPVYVAPDAGAALDPSPPQVRSVGGAVLAFPTFVPVTFAGDPYVDELEDFLASVGCTSYWHTAVSDYGVGDAIAGDPVHVKQSPPQLIDDSEIQSWIQQQIVAKVLPPPKAGTLYVLFYPDTTTVTLFGAQSCQQFGGYHYEVDLGAGTHASYAVIPRCGFGPLGDVGNLTAVTSHELVEAVTDPRPQTDVAYAVTEPDGVAWMLAGGGELGDMCEFEHDAFFLPSDYPFYVQHIWVNSAAFAGKNPCQPADDPYFGAAPLVSDTVQVDVGAGPIMARALKLGVGQSTTIDVKVFANAPLVGSVGVSAYDGAQLSGGQPTLKLGLSQPAGKPGDVLKLTITRVGTNQSYGVEPFVLQSTHGGKSALFWGMVGDP